MTTAVDLDAVLNEAQHFVYSQDSRRDELERHRRVHILTAAGFSAEEIATRLGVSSRTVIRLRGAEPVFPVPPPPVVSETRADQLELWAEFALDMACRLHDENPVLVHETLSRLPKQNLIEVCMVALAGLPIDETPASIFAWVHDLPVQEEN